jgi:hypothetical protein
MIGKMWDRLFGCRHRLITRPITPIHRHDAQPLYTYVACLECGKQFFYDTGKMHVGRPVPLSITTPDCGSGAFQSQC